MAMRMKRSCSWPVSAPVRGFVFAQLLLPLWTPLFEPLPTLRCCAPRRRVSPPDSAACAGGTRTTQRRWPMASSWRSTECRHQLQAWRWNCTTPGAEDTLGPVAQSGGALSSHSGALPGSCDCVDAAAASLPRGAQPGCGDDVKYGYRFARKFVDESEHDRRRHGGGGESRLELVQMNLHNNKAGRLCHGLTGACTLKICWPQLADFRKVGNFLKEKYDASSAVRLVTHNWLEPVDEGFVAPTASELVHVHGSPDYCERDDARGVPGTVGRRCDLRSNGTGDCSIMCCGRGYNTVRVNGGEAVQMQVPVVRSVKCERCPQTV
ncbi:protein Wnt-1-like [Lethenteron reissneri]|uniref:protein Wnt-1-like n=1 Tax=Lethenteron reissneri TaxID=7753 RepID=UPI002AB75667|nr:protein Wnt-1-like [Lethenteron reissneri]